MRRGKMDAQQKLRNPVKQHTPKERLALRRKKRKEGPSAKRRAERRVELQRKDNAAADRFISDIDDMTLISKAGE